MTVTNVECWDLTAPGSHCRGCPFRGRKDGCVRINANSRIINEAAFQLIGAVMKQAAWNYRRNRYMLSVFPHDRETQRIFQNVRTFFLNSNFTVLSGLDGQGIVEQLDKEPIFYDELSEDGDADE